MRPIVAVSILALITTGGLARPLGAQATIDCAYAACAMRVKQGFLGRSLVRGLQDERVAGLGLFVGGMDDAFAGSPLAQDHAARFVSRHNTGSVLTLVGLSVFFLSLFTAGDSGDFYDDSWAVGILAGSAVGLAGALVSASGEDHLHRAVWEYNRGTTR